MKPVYLELCGINSFSERAEVDFARLLEFGIFGIFGDTGSGKSTILDCISFALYGKVSRLDQKEAVISNLINYNSDRAYVNFEFQLTVGGKRKNYRVEREVKRKNGTQNMRVYERKGETLSALAEGVRDGNALIEQIIGLEQKDFEKCIALPQGEFAQFVKSQKSDRLKLISRLFNLEGYGEGLTKRTNARYSETRAHAEILKTRLEPYESVTEDGIVKLTAELKRLATEEQSVERNLSKAREEEKRVSAVFEKRKEYEKTKREMEKLEAEREKMSALNSELGRLEKAAACVTASREYETAKLRVKMEENALAQAEARLKTAEESAVKALEWNAEKAEKEITRLTELAASAESSEFNKKMAENLERRLIEVQNEHCAESGEYADFSYDAEKSAIEKRLAELGGEDFFSFAEEHGRAGLLRTEYAVFAGELIELKDKHSQIAEDVNPLVEKYTKLSAGSKTDFSGIRAEFEKIERLRAQEREKLVVLEKAAGGYKVHLQRLQQLETERANIKRQLDELKLRLTDVGVSKAEIEKKIASLRARQRENASEREKTAQEKSKFLAETAAAQARKKAADERLTEAETRLKDALEQGGFADVSEADALGRKYGDAARVRARVEEYREEYAATKKRLREFGNEDFSAATEVALASAKSALTAAEIAVKTCAQQTALRKKELADAKRNIEAKKAIAKEYGEVRKEAEIYERLKKLLEGNKFMEYVAEEYLQTVALNASGRLLSLTDGRYFLRYEGNFFVGDNFNGGALRGVYTLSGGETFLVSLSLALALSAEICNRSLRPIEFFFLDEGFGTLDEKLVDTVMDSLEKLRGDHFSVGIISHVEELRHRIGRKLLVKKATERHGSQITME